MAAAAGAAFWLVIMGAPAPGQPWANPLSQQGDLWVCYAVSKTDCAGGVCQGRPAQTIIYLNFLSGLYTRCDEGNCTDHEIQTQDVDPRFMALAATGISFRVRTDDFQFAEVTQTGRTQTTLIGACEPV
jgi:hypothetical protein